MDIWRYSGMIDLDALICRNWMMFMTENKEWNSSEKSNAIILQGIVDGLMEAIENEYGPEKTALLIRRIQETRSGLERQFADWIVDGPSVFHLTFMALLVASHRTLQAQLSMDKKQSVELLTAVFVERNRESIREYIRAAMDNAPDPMKMMTETAKEREETFFGKSFAVERIEDNEQTYQVRYTTCFYHAFSKACGAPELMNVLCEWDWNWAAGIIPEKHAFRFERSETLGYGAEACLFSFFRGR